MIMNTMPKIDLNKLKTILTPDEYALVVGIVNTKTGELRASKPKLPKQIVQKNGHYDYVDEADGRKGMTAYIWRMVAFSISPISTHQCMPVMAFCDLPGDYGEEQRQLANRLDDIADKVIGTVKISEWHGVARWAGALGYIR